MATSKKPGKAKRAAKAPPKKAESKTARSLRIGGADFTLEGLRANSYVLQLSIDFECITDEQFEALKDFIGLDCTFALAAKKVSTGGP